MKKILISLVASLTIFVFVAQLTTPASAQAQTNFCYTFNNNLGLGRSLNATDAQALTTALSNADFWSSTTPITTYNDSVASAVSEFQEKYAAQILAPNGLSYGTGFVGASTRAELNTLYGCQSAPATTATAPSQCPDGYVCTPVSQPVAPTCPEGYVCTPIGTSTQSLNVNSSNLDTIGTVNTSTSTQTVTSTTSISVTYSPTTFSLSGYVVSDSIGSSEAGCGVSPNGTELTPCVQNADYIVLSKTYIPTNTAVPVTPSIDNPNFTYVNITGSKGAFPNLGDKVSIQGTINASIPLNPPYSFPMTATDISVISSSASNQVNSIIQNAVQSNF